MNCGMRPALTIQIDSTTWSCIRWGPCGRGYSCLSLPQPVPATFLVPNSFAASESSPTFFPYIQPTSVRYIHPHHHRPQHQPPACTLRTIHGRPFLRPRFGLVCPPRSPSWRSPPLSVSHRQNPIPQNPLQNLPGSATAPHPKPALPNVLEVTVQPRMGTLVATGGGKQMASLVVARTDGSLREMRRPKKTIRE